MVTRDRGAPPLELPPDEQRYSCHSCGRCCRGLFEIRVTPEEQARIEAQGWATRPELDGLPLFRQVPGGMALNHRSDGACVFLDDENHCRIHAEFGESTKPLPCRLYPFVLVPDGDRVRVDLRFDCPSVAGNRGADMASHRAALSGLLAQLRRHLEVPESVLMAGTERVGWGVIREVTAQVLSILSDVSVPIVERLAALVPFSRSLELAPLGSVPETRLEKVVAELRRAAQAGSGGAPEPVPQRVRVLFRQLAASLGRADRIGETARVGGRLATALRMVAGRGTIPAIQETFPPMRFDRLEMGWPAPEPAAALALGRYYRVRVQGFGFFGSACGGRGYAEGLRALVLTAPVIVWYARWFAAAAGEATLGLEPVLRAIQVVDHRYGQSTRWEAANEARRRTVLCEPATLLALLRWYGGGMDNKEG